MARVGIAIAALLILWVGELLSPALAEPIGVTRLLVIAVATILIPPLGTRALLRGHREPPSAQGNRRRRAALRAASILPLLGLLWLTASGLWSELLSRLPPPLGGLALLGVLTPFLLGWLLSEREVWRAEIRRSGESLSPLGVTLTCARPALLLLAVFVAAETASDLVWLRPDLREMWQTDPGVSALGSLLLLLLLLLITPRILGWIHPRESLPEGTLRERFRETARAAGTGLGRVEVWNTHPLLTLNACVTGLLPGQRRVYFTRGLIERLDEEQLAAVFAHELGHSRLHHFWFHTGLILGIGGIAAGAATLLGTGGGGGTGEDGPVELAIIGGTILFLAFFYGHLSRHFENQADLFSADTLGSPNGITSALHQLATLSGADLRRGGWRHPSILARIDRVLSCTFDPRARRRFEGRTRRLQLLCLLILLVGALGGLSSLRARLEEPEWKRGVDRAGVILDGIRARASRPGVDEEWVAREAERARLLLVGALQDPATRPGSAPPGSPPRAEILRRLALTYELLGDPISRAAALYLSTLGSPATPETPPDPSPSGD